MLDFDLSCFQNEYLPRDAREVHAVITITAPEAGHDASNGGVEVIAVDTSESMAGSKILAARQATATAVAALNDGVRFAVIAGNDAARVIYPFDGALAVASPQTRGQAQHASEQLAASGGTAIGSWLRLIADLVREASGIKHAILLTDGKDQSESPEDLERAIAAAQGMFQCDCRGIGTDWVVSELRKISTALLGTVDIVADPSGLASDFKAMVDRAMSKSFADVNLRVWTPQGANIAFVKQVVPELRADYAQKHDIDLVIMATHGRTGLTHLVMGSVTEKVRLPASGVRSPQSMRMVVVLPLPLGPRKP